MCDVIDLRYDHDHVQVEHPRHSTGNLLSLTLTPSWLPSVLSLVKSLLSKYPPNRTALRQSHHVLFTKRPQVIPASLNSSPNSLLPIPFPNRNQSRPSGPSLKSQQILPSLPPPSHLNPPPKRRPLLPPGLAPNPNLIRSAS